MTAADVIAPLVPPPPGSSGRPTTRAENVSLARAPLPLADLPPQRSCAVVYGASKATESHMARKLTKLPSYFLTSGAIVKLGWQAK